MNINGHAPLRSRPRTRARIAVLRVLPAALIHGLDDLRSSIPGMHSLRARSARGGTPLRPRRQPSWTAAPPPPRRAAGVGLAIAVHMSLGIMASLFLCTCDAPGPAPGPDGGSSAFFDHTLDRLDSLAAFEAIAAVAPSSTALKFIITRFGQPEQRALFLESTFYRLHDEWYWFRLLNGATIDGVDTAHVTPAELGRGSFDNIADIVAWARTQPTLPLDLAFVSDGRLYSPRFYELALFSSPKSLGLGTLLHFRARSDVVPPLAEQWAIELEFQHDLSSDELVQLFLALAEALPEDIGPRVKLLVRSQQQEALAVQLESDGSPLAARILRYSDVTVPGETEVYSEGLVAGRLKVVRRGESFDDARASDILVTQDVPDFLPQCAALLTAVPQTALAHVNILAKNRGIPNAYRGALLEDANLDQLARARAPVLVKAAGSNQLQIVAITEGELAQFRALSVVPATAVPPVDLTVVEHTYDLQALDFVDEDLWRPALGGKNFGFIGLLDAGDLTLPPRPLGISIKGFVEHTQELRPTLQAMLLDATFQSDASVRLLVLEGEAAWLSRNPQDPGFPQRFVSTRDSGDALRTLIEGGGVMGLIRSAPMAASTLAAIHTALAHHFGAYSDDQPLRFRSSSNVEDAAGFIGAGLYESFSGYRNASGSNRSAEDAIKEVWATYYGSEAFEERRTANVAHLSGSMGVTVHASFQDEIERGNAVVTFTILPPGHADGTAVLEVNAQEGALSVTNPPPGDVNLPEVARVTLAANDSARIDRLRGSTLLPAGRHVLDDAQLQHVFSQVHRVAALWLAHENLRLPAAQERSTLTIDLELREVADGWPALNNGNSYGARVVIKQARLLEPSTSAPAAVQSMPIPKDILGRTLRIEQKRCTSASAVVTLTDVFTDARKRPDLGFTRAPFTAFVVVDFTGDVPALSATTGQRRSSIHTGYTASHPGMEAGGGYAIDLVIKEANVAAVGLTRLAIANDVLTLERDQGVSAPISCTSEMLFASPEAFLEEILAR